MTDSTDNARGSKACYFCGKPLGGSYSYYWSNACHAECMTKTNVKASRADLAPTPQDARVKALVWDGAGDRLSASAFGLSIAYRITGKPSDWTLMKTGATSYIHEEGFETQKAAKAAAQADYEARIRSALEPDPLADARVQALVEALRLIDKEASQHSEPLLSNHPERAAHGRISRLARAALAAFDKGGKTDE